MNVFNVYFCQQIFALNILFLKRPWGRGHRCFDLRMLVKEAPPYCQHACANNGANMKGPDSGNTLGVASPLYKVTILPLIVIVLLHFDFLPVLAIFT